MQAVILAAGRGSRLGTLTDKIPKGMVELSGHPLLDWQHAALKAGGVTEITVITGYLENVITDRGFKTIWNPDWDRANMVSSLACALERTTGPLLVSYSDIVYGPECVRSLAASSENLAITYDCCWLELWKRRFDDPLSDAETFRIGRNGYIVEIGRQANSVDEVEGQFMGLIKLGDEGRQWIKNMLDQDPGSRLKLDTTSLLQQLIADGRKIGGIPVDGGWCEIDSLDDLAVAEDLVYEGVLVFPENSKGGTL